MSNAQTLQGNNVLLPKSLYNDLVLKHYTCDTLLNIKDSIITRKDSIIDKKDIIITEQKNLLVVKDTIIKAYKEQNDKLIVNYKLKSNNKNSIGYLVFCFILGLSLGLSI